MLSLYRGYWIVLLQDGHLTAEMTEARTNAPLPTKATASRIEGQEICLQRARDLVDLYLASRPETVEPLGCTPVLPAKDGPFTTSPNALIAPDECPRSARQFRSG